MKKYILLLIFPLLFSCSTDEKSTETIVAEIKSGVNLTEEFTETLCGDIIFKTDDNEIRYFYCDMYMGDGGSELSCYFQKGKLIYSEYSMFWDYPVTQNDANGDPYTEWETSAQNYQLYFNNEKFVKCIKDGVEITNLNFDEPDYDPNPSDLVDFAHKVVNAINSTDSEVLCDWF